ncbi:hypothetical protein ACP4OV_002411 [Aristida adscensionis]
MDPSQVVASLLIMLNQREFMLIRIEFLVVAISGLFLAMFIMDFRRNRSHSALRNSVLKILDGVSDDMVTYTLGAMVGVPFRNQLFPVWAMVVVSIRSSVGYISSYESTGRLLGTGMVKAIGIASLYTRRRDLKLKKPLWTLWVVIIVRSLYKGVARNMANQSFWVGHSVDAMAQYMRADHEYSHLKPDVCNPSTMEGYTYLLHGETRHRMLLQKPRYAVFLGVIERQRGSLITLDKIWRCDGPLLRSSGSRGELLKDHCLAFALSGLLRCRLEDAALHGDCVFMTRNLVRSKVLMRNADRAFRIMELELTFVNDALYTRYPVVFWRGLSSLGLSLVVSILTFSATCWLAVDIRKIYKPQKGDEVHIVRGANVDVIITWVLMSFMMFRELWLMLTYLLSDWTRLLLVCKYVQWSCVCMRNSFIEKLIWSFFTSKIGGRWHGLIDQYHFLQSFDYTPSVWNMMNSATLGMVPRKNYGEKLGSAIKLPECVKPAIMRTLRILVPDGQSCLLPSDIPSLNAGDLMDRFGWACKLPRCSQVILVWHIATNLCEINLALDHGVDLSKPSFLRSTLSCIASFCCCKSQPYLIDEKILHGDIKTNYLIANSLSQYCAYLLICQPEMLPDSYLLPDLIFQATVRDARQNLENQDSLQDRYNRLTEDAYSIRDKEAIKQNGNLLEQGAVLGWDLIKLENKELRWKILAGVWADLIVHMAPSWNSTAHLRRLESGGEFATHIWALLSHFGVEKSSLWSGE